MFSRPVFSINLCLPQVYRSLRDSCACAEILFLCLRQNFERMKNIESFCPVRDILARISDKRSILIMYHLLDGCVMRFNQLQRATPQHIAEDAHAGTPQITIDESCYPKDIS